MKFSEKRDKTSRRELEEKSDWSILDRERKSSVSEVERGDAPIASQDGARLSSETSNPSVQPSRSVSKYTVLILITDTTTVNCLELKLGALLNAVMNQLGNHLLSSYSKIEFIPRLSNAKSGAEAGIMSRSPRVYKTWADRWVAYPVSCLFSEDQREEWIEDLYEVRDGLIDRGYPRWLVNLIITSRTLILVASALKITVMDLLSKGFRQSS
jgi:hypothetical protein